VYKKVLRYALKYSKGDRTEYYKKPPQVFTRGGFEFRKESVIL